MPKPTLAVGLGLLLLFVVVAIPASIAVTNNPTTGTYDLAEGESETVTEELRVSVETVGTDTATVTLQDTAAMNTTTKTLNESNTTAYQMPGGTVNATLLEATGNNQVASIQLEYPRTYGWDSGAQTVVNELPLILAAATVIIVVGFASRAIA